MIKLAPDNLFYLELRAKNSIICSNYDQAKEGLARIIDLDPKNAEAYLTRGSLYSFMQSAKAKEQAMSDFSKAIELKEHNTKAYFQRAQIYTQLGQTDKALVDLNIVISVDAKNYEAYFLRAKVHASLNNNKGCLQDLKFIYRNAPAEHPSRKGALNELYKVRDPEVMADIQKGMKTMKKLRDLFGKKKGSDKK